MSIDLEMARNTKSEPIRLFENTIFSQSYRYGCDASDEEGTKFTTLTRTTSEH